MGRHPVGPLAAALPWIAPAAPALIALTEEHPPLERLAADPGILLLLLRYARPSPTPGNCLSPANFDQPILLEAAATHLEQTHSQVWLNRSHESVASLLEAARVIATHAQELAVTTHLCSPAAAWMTGLLAPLGLFAIAAIDPLSIGQHHELSPDSIARRLCVRWRLPHWIAEIIGALPHPTADASVLGADPGLFRVVRAAIGFAEAQGHKLGLLGESGTEDVSTLIAELSGSSRQQVLVNRFLPWDEQENPAEIRLLSPLLRAAARARRAHPTHDDVASQIDLLHKLLAHQRQEFEVALRNAKLSAMAEFAAGAGHEINNPLAIISGNAQLLRSQELPADRQTRLDVIIRQTRRISELLLDLRQFARPTNPKPVRIVLTDVIHDVVSESQPLAMEHDVRIEVERQPVEILADRGQVKRAILEVLTNAVEASPKGEAVKISIQSDSNSALVCIEDQGAGLTKHAEQHLFDPFYSGHSAGRGRGLGLSTAWQFTKLNGGEIHFEKIEGGPTRFTLRFPLVTAQFLRDSSRLSA